MVDPYLTSLREELPGHLHRILFWDYIPWNFVKTRHGDHPNTPLIALLEAYRCLDAVLDLESLAAAALPYDSGGCLRCGTCCVFMRPGAVSEKVFRKWEAVGVPVALFYRTIEKGPHPETYHSWFNGGVRLRMCPFLLVNRIDGKPFCCIHNMGYEFRPDACSRFMPNPPSCQSVPFSPVP